MSNVTVETKAILDIQRLLGCAAFKLGQIRVELLHDTKAPKVDVNRANVEIMKIM